MSVPDFLIVGAMKAGTTTLYQDLIRHPDVFMPEHKEPKTLVRFGDRAAALREYKVLFPGSADRMIKGEASTAYTKRPDFEDIAECAHAVIGAGLRIVYMRRDPVERIVSHYKHWVQRKKIDAPIGQALRDHPELIDYSRYDWQIEPWKRRFGEGAVLEIDLADYAANRISVVEKVLAHIGADPARLPPLEVTFVANSAREMKHIDNKLLDSFIRSRFYGRRVKPLIPRSWREWARRTFLPKPAEIDVRLTDADLAFIASRLESTTEPAA